MQAARALSAPQYTPKGFKAIKRQKERISSLSPWAAFALVTDLLATPALLQLLAGPPLKLSCKHSRLFRTTSWVRSGMWSSRVDVQGSTLLGVFQYFDILLVYV